MYLHVSTYPGVSTRIYANDTILNTNYLRSGEITRRYMYLQVLTHIQVYLRTLSCAFHVRSWPLTLIIKVRESLYIYIYVCIRLTFLHSLTSVMDEQRKTTTRRKKRQPRRRPSTNFYSTRPHKYFSNSRRCIESAERKV